MGLFSGASDKKSNKTKELIKEAISQVIEYLDEYTIVYGNFTKNSLITKKVFNYVIAFKSTPIELVILPIDSNGKVVGEAMYLDENSIFSIKKNLQGVLKISSSVTNKPIQLSIIPYTVDSLESCYQMPINQKEECVAFMQLIRRLK